MGNRLESIGSDDLGVERILQTAHICELNIHSTVSSLLEHLAEPLLHVFAGRMQKHIINVERERDTMEEHERQWTLWGKDEEKVMAKRGDFLVVTTLKLVMYKRDETANPSLLNFE